MECLECHKPLSGNSRKYCSNKCTQRACRKNKKKNGLCPTCSDPVPNSKLCDRCLSLHRKCNKKCFDINYRSRPRYLNLAAKMITSARIRAKKRGLDFTIDDSIPVPEKCPVLGIPLVQNIGKAKDTSPTIDRVDNSKGYVPENVCVISYRANCLKRDSTLDELIRLVEYVASHKNNKKLKVMLEEI